MTAPAVPDTTLDSLLFVKQSPAGGRLCVTGSGVSVRAIIECYNARWTPEQIATDHAPNLRLEGVYAATAYYLANKSQLEAEYAGPNAPRTLLLSTSPSTSGLRRRASSRCLSGSGRRRSPEALAETVFAALSQLSGDDLRNSIQRV